MAPCSWSATIGLFPWKIRGQFLLSRPVCLDEADCRRDQPKLLGCQDCQRGRLDRRRMHLAHQIGGHAQLPLAPARTPAMLSYPIIPCLRPNPHAPGVHSPSYGRCADGLGAIDQRRLAFFPLARDDRKHRRQHRTAVSHPQLRPCIRLRRVANWAQGSPYQGM